MPCRYVLLLNGVRESAPGMVLVTNHECLASPGDNAKNSQERICSHAAAVAVAAGICNRLQLHQFHRPASQISRILVPYYIKGCPLINMLALRSFARVAPRTTLRAAPVRASQRYIAISRPTILSRTTQCKAFSTSRTWRAPAGDGKNMCLP